MAQSYYSYYQSEIVSVPTLILYLAELQITPSIFILQEEKERTPNFLGMGFWVWDQGGSKSALHKTSARITKVSLDL